MVTAKILMWTVLAFLLLSSPPAHNTPRVSSPFNLPIDARTGYFAVFGHPIK